MGFPLSQSVPWIGRQSPRVANLRVDARARGAKADDEIAELIHRRTAHPTPGCVRLVGVLLKDSYRSGRHTAQLEPADGRDIVRFHRIISNQRFVSIPKTSVSQSIHEAVTNPIQAVGSACPQLRHASASGGAKLRKGCSRRAREESKGRACWRDKVYMEVVYVVKTACREFHICVRGTGRRLDVTVQVGRQKWSVIGTQWWKLDKGCRHASYHFRAVKGVRLRTKKCRAG